MNSKKKNNKLDKSLLELSFLVIEKIQNTKIPDNIKNILHKETVDKINFLNALREHKINKIIKFVKQYKDEILKIAFDKYNKTNIGFLKK